jgi:hypothetical protein
MGPLLLKSFREPFVFVHLSHFLDAFRHNSMTSETRPM